MLLSRNSIERGYIMTSAIGKGAWSVVAIAVLASAPALASTSARTSGPMLVAYGPGGPHEALQECAELFRERHGVTVAVVKGSPRELERKIREDGDLYFGGAEYMLEDFARRNPGVLDLESAEKLYPRRIGVVVRKGNPRGIRGWECLTRSDIALLGVDLENMAEVAASHRVGAANVRRRVYTGREGVAAWRSFPDLDAWITYRSWHVELERESEFVELPGAGTLRFTPIAVTSRTRHPDAAREFISFLKSPEAREIFVRHGWE